MRCTARIGNRHECAKAIAAFLVAGRKAETLKIRIRLSASITWMGGLEGLRELEVYKNPLPQHVLKLSERNGVYVLEYLKKQWVVYRGHEQSQN